MSYWFIPILALLAGAGIGYLLFQNLERRKTGGKTAAELKQEHEDYREEVQQHFTKTSDLFQSVTMQYRELYDHLSQGAQSLCDTIPPSPGLDLSDKALLPGASSASNAPQNRKDPASTTPEAERGAEPSPQKTPETRPDDGNDVPVAGDDTQQDDEAMGADAGVAVNTDDTFEGSDKREGDAEAGVPAQDKAPKKSAVQKND